jgi:hypothetical protein
VEKIKETGERVVGCAPDLDGLEERDEEVNPTPAVTV